MKLLSNITKKQWLIILASVLLLGDVVFVATYFIFGNTYFYIQDCLKDIFADLGYTVNFSLYSSPWHTDIPEMQCNYQPFAFWAVLPVTYILKSKIDIKNVPLATFMKDETFFITALIYSIILLIIIAGLLFFVTKKYSKLDDKFCLLTSMIFILSSPFVVQFIRSNVLYFVIIFLEIFFLFYDSEKWYLKEIAYISLAISGVLKIYPILFGILVLNKKDVWGGVRILAYFIILYLVPFAFFDGGFIYNFKAYVSRLLGSANVLRGKTHVNIVSSVNSVVTFVLGKELIDIPFLDKIVSVLVIVFAVISIIALLFEDDEKNQVTLIGGMICLVPAISGYYSACFFVFSFVFFISKEDSKYDLWWQLFFIILFSILFMPAVNRFAGTIIQSFAIFIMQLNLIILGIKKLILKIKNKEMKEWFTGYINGFKTTKTYKEEKIDDVE